MKNPIQFLQFFLSNGLGGGRLGEGHQPAKQILIILEADIFRSITFGADVVMGGSMFAGTDESPGDTIVINDQKFKKYRGMGSLGAMQRGSKDRYFQGDEYDMTKLVPEGVSGHVAYKGALSEVIQQFVGGLRSGMGYLGAETISKLRNASYYTITSAGLNESHIHDIFMVKPSPNYKK